jgi:maltooligosyltrehalose trehalohydrolase
MRIWAPRARRAELLIGRERRPMTAQEGGCFAAPDPPPGADYAFSLDGGDPRPDPRSRWQPHGVHGPSRAIDPAAFSFSTFRAPPLASAVIYELHVGTFSPEGTFDGAAARLEHLTRLGVTHVCVMPVAAFPGTRGWGYDGVHLYAVHDPYGGPEAFARLVESCHRAGLAVLLDVVYNHLGPDGNYLGLYGPYFTDRYRTPWGEALNLDGPGSDQVRRHLIENALFWMERYHVDGLRLDAIHAIVDTSARHLLEELAEETERLAAREGRPLVLIGESDLNDPRVVRPREVGGYGLDAQWSDDLHHALHAALTGERSGYYQDFGPLADVARALRRAYVYDGRYAPHRGRVHGRPAADLPGHRFLGYAQTHDQVGNRARGERLGHLVGPELAGVAAALVLTSPFVPMLFQGEEWNASSPFQYFTDHVSPELAEAVRRGRREEFRAFGWAPEDVPDPQDEATFLRSKLDWAEVKRPPHAAHLELTRKLIALRRSTPDLLDGRLDRVEVDVDEEARWLRVRRGRVTVLANVGKAPARVPRPEGEPDLASGALRGDELAGASFAIWI